MPRHDGRAHITDGTQTLRVLRALPFCDPPQNEKTREDNSGKEKNGRKFQFPHSCPKFFQHRLWPHSSALPSSASSDNSRSLDGGIGGLGEDRGGQALEQQRHVGEVRCHIFYANVLHLEVLGHQQPHDYTAVAVAAGAREDWEPSERTRVRERSKSARAARGARMNRCTRAAGVRKKRGRARPSPQPRRTNERKLSPPTAPTISTFVPCPSPGWGATSHLKDISW